MAKMKSAASVRLSSGIIFIVAGLIFFLVCLGIANDTKRFAETAQETTAVVTNVEKKRVKRNGKYRNDYDVYVQYEVNGITYNEELSGGNSAMKEGQSIVVYYDPANPRDVRKSKSTGIHGFAMIFSLVFAVIGVMVGVVPAIKSENKKKLKETGVQVSAVITDVVLDKGVKINKRYPYKAECEATDPVTGESYLYSSEGIMDDIRYLQGQLVNVYYDPADRSKYYVDLDSADGNVIGGASSVHDFR